MVASHNLLENRHMNDVAGNLFSLFCPAWRACLKMFARLFQIKQVKASKKFWEELFESTKNVAKRDK